MHPYSIYEPRVRVYSLLAILSVALAWLVSLATSPFDWPEWFVGAPSVVGVYALLYRVFDRWFWRTPLAQRFGLAGVPDLSGTYDGKLTSTYRDSAGDNVVRDISLAIQQTWTKMSVEMAVTSGSSTSRSISAVGSISHDGTATRLIYLYQNKVNPGLADDDMRDHEGAADLRIKRDGKLEGSYFNARKRAGTIQATRRPRPIRSDEVERRPHSR
jgi:hypothetical protein